MGSGEGDVAHLKVIASTSNNTSSSDNISWSNWTHTIYKYQVKCPRRGCKRYNWLELDIVTPCYNCGAKLKAVFESPDYTIPVYK